MKAEYMLHGPKKKNTTTIFLCRSTLPTDSIDTSDISTKLPKPVEGGCCLFLSNLAVFTQGHNTP